MVVDIRLVGVSASDELLHDVRRRCADLLRRLGTAGSCEIVIERRPRGLTAVRIHVDSLRGAAWAYDEQRAPRRAVESVLTSVGRDLGSDALEPSVHHRSQREGRFRG